MSKSRRIILILSLCIFLGCAIYIGFYFYNSYTTHTKISHLQRIVDTDDNYDEEVTTEEIEENKPEEYAPNGMIKGYYDAYALNNDMVGWIRLPNTKINYPVMQQDNNEFYLHRNFEKEYQYSGLPFLDYQCDIKLPSDNLIIYAHNMRDGSMFAKLLSYEKKDYYRNNQIVYFDTNYKRGKYQIFAVFRTKVGADDEFVYNEDTHFTDELTFREYIKKVQDNSLYDTGVDVNFGDKLLTLSTCSYNRSNERVVVMAKKIQ